MNPNDVTGRRAPRSTETIFYFDRFEADRECYQLRSGGRTVKLERIPLELLFLLLENAGRLVNREQIVARLWRDDSFLDTERSINTAVRKIRRALEDDPHHPKFIETVIGRGYRFTSATTSQQIRQAYATASQTTAMQDDNLDSSEVRLRGFSVDTSGGEPILTCSVMVGNIDLGRLPILEIELPEQVHLPLTAEDRLLIKLHGIRVVLTSKATQALRAFAVSALQSGLRTRATDYSHRESSRENVMPTDETNKFMES
jgi:DNA-binding winged helix-turn-helix (wHTH) protein